MSLQKRKVEINTYKVLNYIQPLGSLVQILAHPHIGSNKVIELALFEEHRNAFFFWAQWSLKYEKEYKLSIPPSLISLDWHQDLLSPMDEEKEWLSKLNLENNIDVSIFTDFSLRDLNDTHILSAAYLNLIGDVYLHCRQGKNNDDWLDEIFIDLYGNKHFIKKFKTYDELETCMLKSNIESVYFDIDLDFFTINNPYNGLGKKFSYLKKKEIEEMLDINRPLIQWIFERVCGLTIAKEYEHTGGLIKTHKLLEIIDSIYFKPSLFTKMGDQWNKGTKWKHFT